jgi:hypothetical protein
VTKLWHACCLCSSRADSAQRVEALSQRVAEEARLAETAASQAKAAEQQLQVGQKLQSLLPAQLFSVLWLWLLPLKCSAVTVSCSLSAASCSTQSISVRNKTSCVKGSCCPVQMLSKDREQRSGGKIRELQSHVAKLVTECVLCSRLKLNLPYDSTRLVAACRHGFRPTCGDTPMPRAQNAEAASGQKKCL